VLFCAGQKKPDIKISGKDRKGIRVGTETDKKGKVKLWQVYSNNHIQQKTVTESVSAKIPMLVY
jgi:hypothetical protein